MLKLSFFLSLIPGVANRWSRSTGRSRDKFESITTPIRFSWIFSMKKCNTHVYKIYFCLLTTFFFICFQSWQPRKTQVRLVCACVFIYVCYTYYTILFQFLHTNGYIMFLKLLLFYVMLCFIHSYVCIKL